MFHGVIHKITLAQFFWDTVYIMANKSKWQVDNGWQIIYLADQTALRIHTPKFIHDTLYNFAPICN